MSGRHFTALCYSFSLRLNGTTARGEAWGPTDLELNSLQVAVGCDRAETSWVPLILECLSLLSCVKVSFAVS